MSSNKEIKEIDNRGLSCPLPVINTRKALLELVQGAAGGLDLVSIVDNEAALVNVTRMVGREGYETSVERKKDGIYIHIFNDKAGQRDNAGLQSAQRKEQEECCRCGEAGKNVREETTVLITSSRLGEGKEELGTLLMRSFIFSVKEVGFLPARILFMNSAVFLTTEGSPVLDELKELEEKGVQMYSCGTCLDYYQLKDKLVIGQVTNMYDAVEYLHNSTRCLTL